MSGAEQGGGGSPEPSDENYDWTRTYSYWDRWEDPEQGARPAKDDDAKPDRAARSQALSGCCSHDHSAEKRIMDLSEPQKVAACEDFRAKGNAFFEEGQYQRATLQYRQALIYCDYAFPDAGELQTRLDDVRLACLLNSAACFVRAGELGEALEACEQALQERPRCAKALYRRAQVYRLKDEFALAKADLAAAAAAAAPRAADAAALRHERMLLRARETCYGANARALSRQMFGSSGSSGGGGGSDSLGGGSADGSVSGRRGVLPLPRVSKSSLYEAYVPRGGALEVLASLPC
eukprot:TRINITY_DN2355_c0_g1_i2.p1 TRINITY_DN2355_c0_g1~~TRINITY_DN2355_c0_g1_i2.p1  ORF type:complete len:307 (-),score=139.76 TRINITY_DN2355_c0_g1_i2:3-881(-)